MISLGPGIHFTPWFLIFMVFSKSVINVILREIGFEPVFKLAVDNPIDTLLYTINIHGLMTG